MILLFSSSSPNYLASSQETRPRFYFSSTLLFCWPTRVPAPQICGEPSSVNELNRGPFLCVSRRTRRLRVYQHLRARQHFHHHKVASKTRVETSGKENSKGKKKKDRQDTDLIVRVLFFFFLAPSSNKTRREAYKCLTSTFFSLRRDVHNTGSENTLVPSLCSVSFHRFFFIVLQPATDRTAPNTAGIVLFLFKILFYLILFIYLFYLGGGKVKTGLWGSWPTITL